MLREYSTPIGYPVFQVAFSIPAPFVRPAPLQKKINPVRISTLTGSRDGGDPRKAGRTWIVSPPLFNLPEYSPENTGYTAYLFWKPRDRMIDVCSRSKSRSRPATGTER
jgi:hypothetical protein